MSSLEEQIDNEHKMQPLDSELANIIKAAIDEANLSPKDIFKMMDVSDKNGNRPIQTGSLIIKTENLFRFYEVTKSTKLRAYVLSKFGIDTGSHQSEQLKIENERLKADLLVFKKKFFELGKRCSEIGDEAKDFLIEKSIDT